MTAQELAVLRDKVARRRIQIEHGVMPRPRNGWSKERNAAGDRALAALKEAESRVGKQAFKTALAPKVSTRKQPRNLQRRCPYCGELTRRQGWPTVCHGHADLPKLDPAYRAELELRGVAC